MQDEKLAAQIHAERDEGQYSFHEFPKILYRDRPKGDRPKPDGGWVPPEPFMTHIVNSAEEEAAAIDEGWRLTPTRSATSAKPA